MFIYYLFIAFLLAVYEETNTIWFSEYIVQEETMYKLIGVSINRNENNTMDSIVFMLMNCQLRMIYFSDNSSCQIQWRLI